MADRDELIIREAHRSMDNQLALIEQINNKAHRLLRIILILIGFLLTITSFTLHIENGDILLHFINLNTITGLTTLLLTSCSAVITYSDRRMVLGISNQGLKQSLDKQETQITESIVDAYANATENLEHVNRKDGAWLAITNLLVVSSIIFLTAGIMIGVLEIIYINSKTILISLDIALMALNTSLLYIIATAIQINKKSLKQIFNDLNPKHNT